MPFEIMGGRAIPRIGILCGALALSGAMLCVSGWLMGQPRLTDWVNAGISMMPNAAIAIGLAALGLIFRSVQRTVPALLFGGLAGAIGLVTFLQHVTGIDAGIDRAIISADWGQRGTMSPGRMGVPASVMITLLGLATILSTRGKTGRKAAAYLSIICILICSLSIIGFLYGALSFYVIPQWTAISISTTLLLFILSVGIIVVMPDVQPMRTLTEASAAGTLVRRALPILILVPVVIGWLRWETAGSDLIDESFGITIRTILEVILLVTLLWWMAAAVRKHERSLLLSENALRTSEQRYLSFIQQSSEGIWRCELTIPIGIHEPPDRIIDHFYEYGYLAECNDAMARMYGHERGRDLIGTKLGDLLPRTPENEAYLRTFIGSGFNLHDGLSEERDKHGRTLYFSNNLTGIVENGHMVRAWGTQRDITERKAAEKALLESDRRKDEFLATLAHELRNPLSPLMSGLEVLATADGALNEQDRHSIHQMMERQLRHMVRLIDDLMDVSRINRGKILLRKDRVDLSRSMRMAVESVMPMMEKHGHTLQVTMPPRPIQVNGDAVRLVQIFQNILNNAAKYTADGGRISLTTTCTAHEVVIDVKDNGIGLEPQHFDTIFEMFGQVDVSTSRSYPGLGIGLALVKRLVDKHGGSVHAHSDGPGKGTTITVRLPLAGSGVSDVDALAGQLYM